MYLVNAETETLETTAVGEAARENAAPPQFEALFRSEYARVARTIARVVRDRGRAEEIAVDVFVKLWRRRHAPATHSRSWLYRVALRAALDDLRSHVRRERYERLLEWVRPRRPVATPEEIHAAGEEQRRVRATLASTGGRDAQMLLLRLQEFSYDEMAAILEVKPSSVGTLLTRAEERFRKEYIQRYGRE
jgi:RNA polymerase sigma-70 factor (ECF subfamily)